MKISISKKQGRHRLICTRDDGTHTMSDSGPSLPYHDLAHYVVETTLQLHNGFFGNIASGYSIAKLGEKETILALGLKALEAEVLARALTSLHSGACSAEQFLPVVNEEMLRFGGEASNTPSPALAMQMLARYKAVLDQWTRLGDGEALELVFAVT